MSELPREEKKRRLNVKVCFLVNLLFFLLWVIQTSLFFLPSLFWSENKRRANKILLNQKIKSSSKKKKKCGNALVVLKMVGSMCLSLFLHAEIRALIKTRGASFCVMAVCAHFCSSCSCCCFWDCKMKECFPHVTFFQSRILYNVSPSRKIKHNYFFAPFCFKFEFPKSWPWLQEPQSGWPVQKHPLFFFICERRCWMDRPISRPRLNWKKKHNKKK